MPEQNSYLKKLVAYTLFVILHGATTIGVALESIRIKLDIKSQVEFGTLASLYNEVIFALEAALTFPLALLELPGEISFLNGITGVILLVFINSLIQVSMIVGLAGILIKTFSQKLPG